MNPFLGPFVEGLETRFPDDSTSLATSDWITTHTHLKNRRFSFKGYEFQKAIADDMHPDMSVIKLSQIGLSEIQFRKFFAFLKRNVGTVGIFTLPNQPMRDRISVPRVKPFLDSEAIFNGPLVDKPVRRKDLMQVDQSFGYFTGSTEAEATSISADILMHDEIDLSEQSMLGLFQSRLQGSKFQITHRFSTPTYKGFGIDAFYNVSDQYEYLCRCPSCRHWQAPDFERPFLHIPGLPDIEDLSTMTQEQILGLDLRPQSCFVKCEKCHAPLDLTDPSLREWVPTYPSRPTRGYKVRPFCTSNITIPYIIRQLSSAQRLDNLKGWFNTVLGQPFNDANARMSEEDIRACCLSPTIPDPRPSGPVFVGIDVGLTCHVVIGTPDHIFEFHQVPQHELVEFITGRHTSYRFTGGSIDLFPYTPLAEAVRDATKGVIMPTGYATTPTAPTLRPQKDEFDTITHYVANRTKAIDVVARKTRNHAWNFSGLGDNRNVLIAHLRDQIRIEQPDEPPQWQKISGEDHYAHALTHHQLAVRIKDAQDFNSDADIRSGLFVGALQTLTSKDFTLHRTKDTGVLG